MHRVELPCSRDETGGDGGGGGTGLGGIKGDLASSSSGLSQEHVRRLLLLSDMHHVLLLPSPAVGAHEGPSGRWAGATA